MKKTKGFSAVEILIVVAIMGLVAGSIFYSFSSFSKEQSLTSAVETFKTALNEARSKTLSSLGDSQYGVHIENTKAVLFKGTTYSASDANNVAFVMPTAVEIVSISLNGGGANMVFQKITGKTNQYGSAIIRLRSNIAKSKTITINQSGTITTQ
jgi:prepilin-type N-terminal cleavage/methylation domain-containing protein